MRHIDLSVQAVVCGGPHLSGLMPMVWMPQLPYAGELSLAACCADALGGAAGIGTRRTWAVKVRSLCLVLGTVISVLASTSHASLPRTLDLSVRIMHSHVTISVCKGIWHGTPSIASPSVWLC